MNTHRVTLLGGSEGETAEIQEFEGQEKCHLVLMYRGKRIEAAADDYFEALTSIRLELQAEGLTLGCYGASLNVYPSAMSRQMSQGVLAYRMTKGKQAISADLVRIFASGSDVQPATVAEQRRFFDEWLNSLG